MKRRSRQFNCGLLLATLLCGFQAAAAVEHSAKSAPLPNVLSVNTPSALCQPQFPFLQNWLGGDGIYSVALPDGRSLWLFGDTFMGPGPDRAGALMVANTIGISRCGPQGFKIDYHAGRSAKGEAAAFFAQGPHKLWPIHGFEYQGKLYIGLEQVAVTAGPENGFNFEIVGVYLAEISDYQLAPAQWQIRYLELSDSRSVIPGLAMVKQGDYVYLLSVREDANKRHPLLLHRLSLKQLESPIGQLEYLDQHRSWRRGLEGEDALILVPQAATEVSLHFDPNRQTWIMVHTQPEFMGKNVIIRQAPALEGPWDQQITSLPLYTEMMSESTGYDKNTFCYAAKAHPQFSPPIMLTYACNSLDFATLFRRLELYRPVVQTLPLPASPP
ncbi:MAG: hypothetical protein CVV27_05450 [Candidatus Melainabacteria bacterium HGW-Melainabacteria-1]|nr:MAG: hypothetical protein CVV27_05450 [Candidatus Melainabacteria bacterium HGW-Melainabacteria-1]